MARIHIPALDGARGLAAATVVVSHASNSRFLPEVLGAGLGVMGVCLFYALSGFLMGLLYLKAPLDKVAFRRYAVSRGARVLPLYYVVILLGCVLLVGIGDSGYSFTTLNELILNVFLLRGTGVLWSIPVEIHFYLVFIGLWFAASRGWFFAAVLGLLVLQVLLAKGLGPWLVGARYLVLWLHVFLFGCLLAWFYQTRTGLLAVSKWRGAHLLAWGLLVLAPLAPPEIRRMLGIPVGEVFLDPFSVGYPLLILVCSVLELGPFRFLAARWLRWLGRVSFSLYLLHIPILIFCSGIGLNDVGVPGLAFVVFVTVALVLSELSVRFIELPAQSALRAAFLPRRPKPALDQTEN